jgi:hypothetical protein
MTRTDRHVAHRDRAEAVAFRTAQEACGLFLRAFEAVRHRRRL